MARHFKYTDEELESIVRRSIARINGQDDTQSQESGLTTNEGIFLTKITPPRLTVEAKKIDPRFELTDARKPIAKQILDQHNKKYDDYCKRVLGDTEVIKRLSGPNFFQVYLRINNGDIGKATMELAQDLSVLTEDYTLQAQHIKHLEKRCKQLEQITAGMGDIQEVTIMQQNETSKLRSQIESLKAQIAELQGEMDEFVKARGMEILQECGVPLTKDAAKIVRLTEKKWGK